MKTGILLKLTVCALAMAMSGCGGGGGGDGDSGTASVTSTGVISAFGSVLLNGVEWDTAGSHISSDGLPCADDGCLKVGMKVHLKGEMENDGLHGRAGTIDYRDDMEGMVMDNRVDPVTMTGEMDVMGHTVSVTTRSAFDCDIANVAGVHQVTAGQVLEVSGHSSGTGRIEATRMECKADTVANYLATHAEGMETKGVVSAHDEMNRTFVMGNMDVSYAGADVAAMPQGSWNGLYVEMHSVLGMQGGVMMASNVRFENDGNIGYEGVEGEDYYLMGAITALCNDSLMDSYCMVDGRRVLVRSETDMHDHEDTHMDMMQFPVGMSVRVHGHFNADRELVADEMEAFDQYNDDQAYTGIVAIVNMPDVSNPNTGIVTLAGGLIFHVNYDTMMEDDCEMTCVNQDHFNLGYLAAGDHVEIRAYTDGGGDRIATKCTREDG